jgi:spore maturation protein CgeB
MRVLFLDKSPIWINGLTYGFRDAGHDIMASGPITKQNITKIIKKFAPDLIVIIGWGPEQSPKKQEWIRESAQSAGIPHIYWATEDPHFTEIFTLPLILRMQPVFVFTISRRIVDFYKKLGIRAAHLDFGYHPAIHRRIEPQNCYRSAIAVVANAYPNVLSKWPSHYRNQSLQTLIKPLIQKNIRIDFWGRNWDEMKPFLGQDIPSDWLHGHLTYPEAHKVYSSAKIIIGLQNYQEQVTQRTYETLGSGGFLITSDTSGVRQLFKPGRDLVVTASPKETVSTIEYFLHHPNEREKIRNQGKTTVAAHSYKLRAEYIINVLQNEGVLRDN